MKEEIDIAIKEWAKRVRKRSKVTPKYLASTLKHDFKKIGLYVDVYTEDFIEIDDYIYDPDIFAVSGPYVPDIPTYDFEIRFLFPLDSAAGFKITKGWVDAFSLEVAQVAIHENKHKEQAESRDGGFVTPAYRHADTRNEEYLGNYDEIDAYGLSIAYQLSEELGTVAALDLLR